ncbi:MAG: flap endonuclease-1 [Candidatus Hodarchaeota archaeon]
MGTNLGSLVKPVRKIVDLTAFQGRMLSVDANNILYQFLSIIRERDGTLFNWNGMITSHLIGLFYRTTRLITDFGMRLAFVFDGEPIELKRAELERRSKAKVKAEKAWKAALEVGDLQTAFSKAVVTSRLTSDLIADSKYLLSLLGIPVIDAPRDAEAQTAFMVRTNKRFWAANSQDYDSLLYGGPRQARYLSISGKYRNINLPSQPELIELQKLLSYYGITQNQLIDLGILLGTDFNEKVPGVGPKTGLRLVRDYGCLEVMPEKIRSKIPEHYEQIRDLYLHPEVTSNYLIEFGPLQEEELMAFLCQERGFSKDRVKSVIGRMNKSYEQKKQVGLERWLNEP